MLVKMSDKTMKERLQESLEIIKESVKTPGKRDNETLGKVKAAQSLINRAITTIISDPEVEYVDLKDDLYNQLVISHRYLNQDMNRFTRFSSLGQYPSINDVVEKTK